MNSRHWINTCLVLATATFSASIARAEYSTAPGDIEAATRDASAQYNSASADFHIMMAGIDLRQIDVANSAQFKAVDEFKIAATKYGASADNASTRDLAPKKRNAQDTQRNAQDKAISTFSSLRRRSTGSHSL